MPRWLASAHRTAWCALALVALLASGAARAQAGRRLADPRGPREGAALGRALDPPIRRAPASPSGWALDLVAVTSVPLSVGVEAIAETPVGLTAQLSFGHTPNAYLDGVASALRGTGVYEANVERVVREAIAGGAWNVRAGVGFTLREGLELAVGYTFLGGNASLSPNALEAAVGHPLRWPGMTVVPLAVEVHALHARLGWRFVIAEHLVLRVAIGWAHAVATSARVEVPAEHDPPGGPADRLEEGIERALGRYGFTPEVILSAGYRF